MSSSPPASFSLGIVPSLDDQLRKKLLDELDTTSSKWKGGSVPISSTQFSLADGQRTLVNAIGQQHFCHECGGDISKDKNQPWTGDHSYPTNLEPHVLDALYEIRVEGQQVFERRATQYLFPQCQQCSVDQAALVRQMNQWDRQKIHLEMAKNTELSKAYRLLHGYRAPVPGDNCILTTVPKVSDEQGRQIQELGETQGCHSSRAPDLHKYPTSIYIADHVPPQEFMTNYMKEVMNELKIAGPTKMCPQAPVLAVFFFSRGTDSGH